MAELGDIGGLDVAIDGEDMPSEENNIPQETMVGSVNSMTGEISTIVSNPPYGQVLVVGPPNSSAKIIGILVIIWGGFNLFGGLIGIVGAEFLANLVGSDPSLGIDDPDGYKNFVLLASGVSLILGVGYMTSGIWMTRFQTRGVQLALVVLGISLITDIILGTMYPEFGTGNRALEVGGTVFCTAICGLITAIPFMVANNGLDGTSLFSPETIGEKTYDTQ